MLNKNKIFCVIPARKGSKRLKNKNILKYNKKYLITYTINAALKSKLFEEIIVSSDIPKLKSITLEYDEKKLKFIDRPKNLAGDKSTVSDVVKDLLKKFKHLNKYKFLCVLYPTSALRDEKDIKKTYKKMLLLKANYCLAVSSYNFFPHKALVLKGKNFLVPMFKKIYLKKSNDFTNKIFVDNGSTYFTKLSEFKKNYRFYGKKQTFYFMPQQKSVDLDTPEDFVLLKKKLMIQGIK